MTLRTIRRIAPAPVSRMGPGLSTRDAGAEMLGEDMDPFIMVSLYEMTGPTFPPHPHAGFAVATYMLPESPLGFVNQDSLGHHNAIPPGAFHVTVAGSGVMHEEQPTSRGGVARGYQIWIDLKNGQRAVAPHALHLPAADVPVFDADGAHVRVVLGEAMGLRSPLLLPVAVRLLDVTLLPGAVFEPDLAAEENAFVVMVGGQVLVNGQAASAADLVRTAPDGEQLRFSAGPDGARFTLFSGMPWRQPRVQRGPMVAGDAAELQSFMRHYAAGQFGQLKPFAEQAQMR
jgi:redox-sensitive bicupin YhaK (pirin superfamily)